MRFLLLSLSIAFLCTAQDQPAYEAAFTDLPSAVVESGRLSATVDYRLPPGKGPARLHCEMKSGTGAYLKGQEKLVTGTGAVDFVFAAPPCTMAARVRLITWIGERWDRSLCPLVRSPMIDIQSQYRARRLAELKREAPARLDGIRQAPGAGRRIGVCQADPSPWPKSIAADLIRDLRAAGLDAVAVNPSVAANPYVLRPDVFDALILVDAAVLPAEGRYSLPDYLHSGGALIALGGPAFQTTLWRHGAEWLTRDDYRQRTASSLAVRKLCDFSTNSGGAWERSSNNPSADSRVVWTAESAPKNQGGAVRIQVRDLNGWDTFTVPKLPNAPFGQDATWTSFWAKGDSHTNELAIEWREKDGSRWIATTAITTEWRQYVLPPQAFRLWDPDNATHGTRTDGFQPQHADTLIFGLAFTHTRDVGRGDHAIWLDAIGVAKAPGPNIDAAALTAEPVTAPVIEGISPPWKFYPVSSVASLHSTPGQVWSLANALPTGSHIYSPYARPSGTGIHKSRPCRFQSVIDCVDAKGRFCGSAAAVVLYAPSSNRIPIVATLPIADATFFTAPPGRTTVIDLVRKCTEGLFFYEAGASWYASFGNEQVPVGALVVNRREEPAKGEVILRVNDPSGHTVWKRRCTLEVPPGGTVRTEDVWTAPRPGTESAEYTVLCELRTNGKIVDRLSHPLRLIAVPTKPRYMTREHSGFRLNGRPWFAHGVNYMPSSGVALELTGNFEFWLDPAPYDPQIIERDLADIEAIGFNCVSVFQYYRSKDSHNLLDLLDRCRDHHLKVNLSLRPGTPLDFRWNEVREMIQGGRLARNDTVFAYDLAWEPSWGPHDRRKRWDGEWEKWVLARYGTVVNAEKAWGYPIPRENGHTTNPADKVVSENGPWRKLAVDYRQFLNSLLDKYYGRARTLVREVDPNHLVSFRMSAAGDPTAGQGGIPYDFAGLSKAVDILEPEGYGRIGDWDRVKAGWFTAAYARCIAPDLPVMWAEFGYSTWDRSRMASNPASLDFQSRFLDDFYRMVYLSGADGSIVWWFPGGYRWNERSDYGILNPDRSWRPATRAIARWATKIRTPHPHPTPTVWLDFRHDNHADGLRGVYTKLQKRFFGAIDAGDFPGLRERKP